MLSRVLTVAFATAGCLYAGLSGAAAKPPGFVTGVSAGAPDPRGIIPNANKVPNTQDDNFDIAIPQSVLTPGLQYAYTITSQNFGFKGSCTTSFALVQTAHGSTTTLDSGTIATYNCAAGDVFIYFTYGKPIPASPGPATLIGTVSFGGKAVSLKQPVFIK